MGPATIRDDPLQPADVRPRVCVAPGLRRIPGSDAVPDLAPAVAARAPAAVAVVVVADRRSVIVEVEGGRFPAQGLGARADVAIRSPLHLGNSEGLVDLAASLDARL